MIITQKTYNKLLKDTKKEFPDISEEIIRKELNAAIGERYLRILNEAIQKNLKEK